MKRSRMLGDIYELLYKNTDINEDVLEDLTVQILDKCESNGMVPPLIRTQDYMDFSSDEPGGYYPTANEWENENEEE